VRVGLAVDWEGRRKKFFEFLNKNPLCTASTVRTAGLGTALQFFFGNNLNEAKRDAGIAVTLCVIIILLCNGITSAIDGDALKVLDPRLPVLVNDDSIWQKIDQKGLFVNDEKYRTVLERSFERAAQILPQVFNKVNRKNFQKLSTCIYDSKIFIQFKQESTNFIGWVPIVYLNKFDPNVNITVLAIPSDDEARLLSVFFRESKALDLQTKPALSDLLLPLNKTLMEVIGIKIEELDEGNSEGNMLALKGKIQRAFIFERATRYIRLCT
jgi:hypothetical protein